MPAKKLMLLGMLTLTQAWIFQQVRQRKLARELEGEDKGRNAKALQTWDDEGGASPLKGPQTAQKTAKTAQSMSGAISGSGPMMAQAAEGSSSSGGGAGLSGVVSQGDRPSWPTDEPYLTPGSSQ